MLLGNLAGPRGRGSYYTITVTRKSQKSSTLSWKNVENKFPLDAEIICGRSKSGVWSGFEGAWVGGGAAGQELLLSFHFGKT